MFTIAVTGGRNYENSANVWTTLDSLVEEFGPFVLHVGDASGADASARDWAAFRGNEVRIFRANWTKFKRAAGPIRNAEMLLTADLLIAFEGGRGTADAKRTAKKSGIPIREH